MLERYRRRKRWLAVVLAIMAVSFALPGFASAQSAPIDAAPAADSQGGDLGEALEQFGRQRGFDIVFPETLVRGLSAGRVDPRANPYRALEQLLRGTGLVARFTRPNAIVLERLRTANAPDMLLDNLEVRPPSFARAQEYQWYGQRLLDESLLLLRGTTGLVTRSYDLFIYLWVDGDGRVTEARIYGGNGEQREADLAARVLKGLALKIAPPTDMPQPVGLRIASH